jgi:hypothetical protein
MGAPLVQGSNGDCNHQTSPRHHQTSRQAEAEEIPEKEEEQKASFVAPSSPIDYID